MFFNRQHEKDQNAPDRQSLNGKKLILPLSLEEGRVPDLMRNMTFFICVLVGAMVVWAGVAEIREMAITQGKIVPTGAVKTVNHLEGGIVEDILRQEGELIEIGSPLVRLRPQAAKNDLEQLQIRAASFSLQKERLLSLLQKRPLSVPSRNIKKTHPRLVSDQVELFNTQISLHKRKARTFQARIDQRRIELESLDLEAASLTRQIELKKDQLHSTKELYKQKHSTRRALIEAESDYEKTLARSIALNGRRIGAKEALNEAKSLFLEWQANLRKTLGSELATVSTELAELEKTIAKQSDRVDRLLVRSPVRGIVQHLAFNSQGEVVKPGEIIAKIVPVDEKIVAEVRLNPRDIGHVKIGDPAEIKISAFDPNVYGRLQGKVTKLSASTFLSEQGETYFKAIIALERNNIGQVGALHKITPGMVVQADIVTGAKSMIQYLLKPVYRSLNSAFSER